jgi:hypothetical protein
LVWPLTVVLDEARHVLGGLLTEEGALRVGAAAAHLPAALTRFLYLECWLRSQPGRGDLIVSVDPQTRGWLDVAPLPGPLPLDRACRQGWRRLAEFSRRWADGTDEWSQSLQRIWLELDQPQGPTPTGLGVPRIFFDSEGSGLAAALGPLSALIGREPPRDLHRSLASCLDRLPPGARFLSLGLTQIDRWDPLRVCVSGLLFRELAPFLRGLGWPGDLDAVMAVHAELTDGVPGASGRLGLLQIDIGSSWHGGLGLEYGLALDGTGSTRLDQAQFLDALTRSGVLGPAQRGALERWSARERRVLPHQLWPSQVVRRINHVKVVHRGGGSVDVKVYLALSHTFLPGVEGVDRARGFYR